MLTVPRRRGGLDRGMVGIIVERVSLGCCRCGLGKTLLGSIGLRVDQSESVLGADLQVVNDAFSAQPHLGETFEVLDTAAGMESRG